jgi:hypothetical protein
MSAGVLGEKERLSIGFLDMSEDLLTKLPAFLSTFDAVILNDGDFEFVSKVVHELLQVPEQVPVTQRVANRLTSFIDRMDIF